MLEKIQKAEEALVRVETWILAACLLTMLVLAGYNVFYRNILVPWQVSLKSSGPPVTEQESESGGVGSEESESGEGGSEESESEESGGFGGGFGGGESDEASSEEDEAGGFGGGFGGTDEEKDESGEEKSADDGAGGFGGGFGGDGEADGADEKGGKEASDESAGGFGGGFGGGDEETADDGAGDESSGGFGGGFGGGDDETADSDEKETGEPDETPDEETAEEPEGGPPPEGSFGAFMIDAIDAVKLSWIDIFIRQLVLIVGFLGALLATRRREHITIDAVGQIITGRTRHIVDTVTSSFALVICGVLAVSGWRLVAIGMEWPRELLPWAMEWHFQLAFPVGFGMMALHFALRTLESGVMAYRDMPVEESESAVETPDDSEDDDSEDDEPEDDEPEDDDTDDEPDLEEKSTDEQGGTS